MTPSQDRTERFPRTAELPTQSPLFWVQQKDRYLRQLLIRDVEALTQRRLIVYFANRFENAQIDARDVKLMAEVLGDIGDAPVDLLLETSGGVTDATEGLISLVRHVVADLRVVVPGAAKSNGTLLCLAARSIVMGAVSELGPIEPLVQGIPCSILIQPHIAQQNFALHKYGEFALQQSRTLAKTLLGSGMMSGRPDAEIEKVVQMLASRDTYFSHGSVIDYQEAAAIGLAIDYLPPENPIWQRLWLLHCMYEHDCQAAGYLKVFEGHSRSTAIATPPKANGAVAGK